MIDKELIIKLNKSGKTCQEIRDELGYSLTTIRKYIKESGLKTNSKKSIIDNNILNKISVYIDEGKTNLEIANILNMSPTTVRKYTKKLGKDTNSKKSKGLKNINLKLSNEQLEVLYGSLLGLFNEDQEVINKLTEISLGFWFMDDGSNSGILATNCFSRDECVLIQQFLKEKFNIDTTLETSNKQYLVYIKKCSRKHFYEITSKYFIPSMMYKIHNWNL